MRKDSLGSVYRRLVKELHPDLEPDPAERERKSRVMQDITAAYAGGDLHALLRLELEWLEPGGQTRLGVESLAGISPGGGYASFSTTICNPGTSAKSLPFDVSSRKSR